MAIDSAAKRNAALLDQPVLFPDGTIDSDDRGYLLDEYFVPTAAVVTPPAAPTGTFTPPTRSGAAFMGETPAGTALFRHYGTVTEGRNVFLMTDGTITENDPIDWDLVARAWWGGHVEPVTDHEKTLLTAAGYGAFLT